jgi:hypothetical protein
LLHTGAGPPPELIVSDGGSTDRTPEIAGAAVATGEVLYFLHADTFPPANYKEQIVANCTSACGAGYFRLQFDAIHWFLQLKAWFTRFDVDSLRFGDQSLYVLRRSFRQINGFQSELLLLEDQEIIHRIPQTARL